MNYKLTVQYDGTDFHGWQMQDELRTVQGDLTRALSVIESRPVVIHGSGRTDAGVHAEGQVASVQLAREITPEKLRAAINGNLNSDVRVIEIEPVPDDFHARYSARGKTYLYRIASGPVLSPFWRHFAQHEARLLNLTRMKVTANLFLGTHDWTAFSATQSDAENRIRTVSALEIAEQIEHLGGARLIGIKISADGFLRYMVRMIVGTLLSAGRGDVDDQAVANAISNADRTSVGPTAPPGGLTLLKVLYDY